MQLPAEVIGVCVTSHSSPHVLHQQIIAVACQHDGYTEGLTVLHQQIIAVACQHDGYTEGLTVLHQQIIAVACQHDGYTEGLTVLHQQKEDPYVDKAAFCRQRNPKQMGKALPRTSFQPIDCNVTGANVGMNR